MPSNLNTTFLFANINSIQAQKLASPGILDGEALNLVTHGTDLASKLAGVIASDASSNDSTADTASTAEVHLAGDVDVRNYKTSLAPL